MLIRLPITRKKIGNIRKTKILKTCQNLTIERKKNKQNQAIEHFTKLHFSGARNEREMREKRERIKDKKEKEHRNIRQIQQSKKRKVT